MRFIDLHAAGAWRYVRLDVESTWAAETVPTYYRQLKIDELWLGSQYARPAQHWR